MGSGKPLQALQVPLQARYRLSLQVALQALQVPNQ